MYWTSCKDDHNHCRKTVGLDVEPVRAAVEVLGRGAVEGDGGLAVVGPRCAAELRGGGVRKEPAICQRRELRAPGNKGQGANIYRTAVSEKAMRARARGQCYAALH